MFLPMISLQEETKSVIRVFTTLADTLFGVSFLALSPEHELLQRKELFTESVLKAVDEIWNSSSLNRHGIDTNTRPKKGIGYIR